MFCVAQAKPGIIGGHACETVAGLGLIRASVENPNGTSNLILQGLARVRLVNFVQYKPFPVAQISELRSSVENPVEADALGAKVLGICRSLKGKNGDLNTLLNQQAAHTASPEAISDFVAQAFVIDPAARQEILEELCVCARLRLLIAWLHEDAC